MRLFNIAMLGRQVWRLIHNKESLCYKVLSSKYFPQRDIFKVKNVNKPSFAWKSIYGATRELEKGFGWQLVTVGTLI